MERWFNSAAYVDKNEVYKLKKDNKLIGHYSFQSADSKKVKLDNILIDPEFRI